MFSVAKLMFWYSKTPLIALLWLLSFPCLGLTRSAQHYAPSVFERSPHDFSRPVILNRPWGEHRDLFGLELVSEDPNRRFTRDDIDRFVKEGYDSLPDRLKAADQQFLIAALWIPNYGYTMSSSPNSFDLVKEEMYETSEQVAPVWGSEVYERKDSKGNVVRQYHAEDGACYLYEKSVTPKNLCPGWGYPSYGTEKPYMVVYGRRQRNVPPGYVAFCSKDGPGGSSMDPDCATVMESLGIEKKL